MAKIITFKRAKSECEHLSIVVTEGLWRIECDDCHEKLDPVAWLLKRADEEGAMEWRFDRLAKALAKRKRTKCQHCGKMTSIS